MAWERTGEKETHFILIKFDISPECLFTLCLYKLGENKTNCSYNGANSLIWQTEMLTFEKGIIIVSRGTSFYLENRSSLVGAPWCWHWWLKFRSETSDFFKGKIDSYTWQKKLNAVQRCIFQFFIFLLFIIIFFFLSLHCFKEIKAHSIIRVLSKVKFQLGSINYHQTGSGNNKRTN